jgi:hypothetical protein
VGDCAGGVCSSKVTRTEYDVRVLRVLKLIAAAGASIDLALHVASFFVPVNIPWLQLTLTVSCMLLVFAGALSFFPSDTETEGTTLVVKDSAFRYVPRWMKLIPIALSLYALAGFKLQLPEVTDYSVTKMSPTLARWASVAVAMFFALAAVMLHGAQRIRENEYVK